MTERWERRRMSFHVVGILVITFCPLLQVLMTTSARLWVACAADNLAAVVSLWLTSSILKPSQDSLKMILRTSLEDTKPSWESLKMISRTSLENTNLLEAVSRWSQDQFKPSRDCLELFMTSLETNIKTLFVTWDTCKRLCWRQSHMSTHACWILARLSVDRHKKNFFIKKASQVGRKRIRCPDKEHDRKDFERRCWESQKGDCDGMEGLPKDCWDGCDSLEGDCCQDWRVGRPHRPRTKVCRRPPKINSSLRKFEHGSDGCWARLESLWSVC